MSAEGVADVVPLERAARQSEAAANVESPMASLEALYVERFEPMVRLATMLTRSAATGEEIVQDAFVALHQAWDRIEGDPAPYLRRIVTNACMSHHRHEAVVARHLSVDDRVALPPEIDEMWDALQFLTDRQRIALILRFYEDLSLQSVADAMDCRLGTAKSLVHRGLQALKEVLEDD